MFLILVAVFALSCWRVEAGKRGLAWPFYNEALDPSVLKSESVVAIYDWETYLPPMAADGDLSGFSIIGTQAKPDSESSPIGELEKRAAEQKWDTIFTLNEPDLYGPNAREAAEWYSSYISHLSLKRALPSVTNSVEEGRGLKWLDSFLSECEKDSTLDCSFDYINLHWYGDTTADFQSYVEGAYEKYHIKYPNATFVITEFALQNPAGGQADQIAFFTKAFTFLDSDEASYVSLYFPFVATTPDLLTKEAPDAAKHAGTGSCLFDNNLSPSKLGNLFMEG